MILISKKINDKVYFILLLVVAALVPTAEALPVKLASLSIILLTFWWLVSGDYKQKYERFRSNRLLWLFAALFLINLPAFAFVKLPAEATDLVVRKLPLLLLPLVIGTSRLLTMRQTNYIIAAFISGLFVVSLFTFREGLMVLLDRHDLTTMVRLTLLHRPYAGMFSAFAIVALAYLFRQYTYIACRALLILAMLYFAFYIYILYAKMTVIAFIVLLGIFCIIGAAKKINKYILLAVGFLLLSSGIWYINTNEKVKVVLSKISNFEDFSYQEYNIHLVSSINIRYINWGCSLEVLKQEQNWLLGLGIGNAQDQLNLCYKDLNPWIYESEMNAHNEFLEEMLRNGLPGLFLFVLCLAVPAFMSLYYQNYIYFSFIVLFAICCITESIFSRQAGILFYALFNSILAFSNLRLQIMNR